MTAPAVTGLDILSTDSNTYTGPGTVIVLLDPHSPESGEQRIHSEIAESSQLINTLFKEDILYLREGLRRVKDGQQ